MASLAWDSLTLVFLLVAFLYMYRLYGVFRGGELGRFYGYYVASGAVLVIGFSMKIILDLLAITPEDYGLSVRDPAIIIALLLFALGLRGSARIWRPPPKS
jgi:hypothetical protein